MIRNLLGFLAPSPVAGGVRPAAVVGVPAIAAGPIDAFSLARAQALLAEVTRLAEGGMARVTTRFIPAGGFAITGTIAFLEKRFLDARNERVGTAERQRLVGELENFETEELERIAREEEGDRVHEALGALYGLGTFGNLRVVPALVQLYSRIPEAGLWLIELSDKGTQAVRHEAREALAGLSTSPFDRRPVAQVQRLADLSEGVPDPLPALLRARQGILQLDQEVDHDLSARDLISGQVMAYRAEAAGAAARMTLSFKMTPSELNVRDLRHEALIGLYCIVADQHHPYFHWYHKGRRRFVARLNLDKIYRRDFPELRGLFVLEDLVQFTFERPIDVGRVTSLIMDQQSRFSIEPAKGHGRVVIRLGQEAVIYLTPYSVEVPHGAMASHPERFLRSLNLATRLIEAIQQDLLYSKAYQEVNMEVFRVFFDALTGEPPRSDFADLGAFVLAELPGIRGGKSRTFHETRQSFATRFRLRERGTELDQLPPPKYVMDDETGSKPGHIRYVIVQNGPTPSLILGSDLNVQEDRLASVLRELLPEVEVEETQERKWAQAGSHMGRPRRVWNVTVGSGDEKRRLISFSLQTMEIPITERTDDFRTAMRLLDELYRRAPFVTATHKVGKLRAGLSDAERAVLPVWNFVDRLYHKFVQLLMGHAWAAGTVSEELPSPQIWAARLMEQAPVQTTEGRLLHLYRQVFTMIVPDEMNLFGPGAHDLYEALGTQIRSLEAIVGATGGTGASRAVSLRAHDAAQADATDAAPGPGLPPEPPAEVVERWFEVVAAACRGWSRHDTDAAKRRKVRDAVATASLDLDGILRALAPLDPARLKGKIRLLHESLYANARFPMPNPKPRA